MIDLTLIFVNNLLIILRVFLVKHLVNQTNNLNLEII